MKSKSLSTLFLKIFGLATLLAVVFTTIALTISYANYDQESSEITDAVRNTSIGRFVKLPDGFTHYEIAGPEDAKTTVVLVHGFSVPYYIWDKNFDILAGSGFLVLRYDLYGRGLSDRPDTVYNAELYDRQLTGLLSALQIHRPINIAGVSLGGPISITFADRHPELVQSVALFDPAFLTGQVQPWKVATPYVGEFWMCTERAPGLPAGQKEDFVHPEKYPHYFTQYSEQMRFKGFRRALLSTLRNYSTRDSTAEYERTGKSGKPVFLVWGKADKAVPFETSNKVLKAIPQAEFHPVENAAHVPFYEQPEVINSLFTAFLNRIG